MEKLMNTIYIGANSPSRLMKIVGYNGKKFKYNIEFSNGDPCGFNYKQSISIMKSDGTWEYIADSKSLGCEVDNCYYADDVIKTRNRDKLIIAFDVFIKSVY